MTRVPFAARVAAGVAVTVVEEARKLPNTAVTFPMTVVSEVLAGTMRFQQQVTALAIKGDHIIAVLPIIGTPDEAQPSWAVFDDDEDAGPGRDFPPADLADLTNGDVDVPDREAPAATGRFFSRVMERPSGCGRAAKARATRLSPGSPTLLANSPSTRTSSRSALCALKTSPCSQKANSVSSS